MIRVEDWAEIRRLHRAEQMPIRAIARHRGISSLHDRPHGSPGALAAARPSRNRRIQPKAQPPARAHAAPRGSASRTVRQGGHALAVRSAFSRATAVRNCRTLPSIERGSPEVSSLPIPTATAPARM